MTRERFIVIATEEGLTSEQASNAWNDRPEPLRQSDDPPIDEVMIRSVLRHWAPKYQDLARRKNYKDN